MAGGNKKTISQVVADYKKDSESKAKKQKLKEHGISTKYEGYITDRLLNSLDYSEKQRERQKARENEQRTQAKVQKTNTFIQNVQKSDKSFSTAAQQLKSSTAQDSYFDRLNQQMMSKGKELYQKSILGQPTEQTVKHTVVAGAAPEPKKAAQTVKTTIPTGAAATAQQPQTASKTSLNEIIANVNKMKGQAAGKGGQTGTVGNKTGTGNRLDGLIYGKTGRNQTSGQTQNVPASIAMPNVKAAGKTAPAGVKVTAEEAWERMQQPTQQTAQTAERPKVYKSDAEIRMEHDLIGNRIKEGQKAKAEQQKKELDEFINDADPMQMTDRNMRNYARQYWQNRKAELQQAKASYDGDAGAARNRIAGEWEYRKTPQGELRWLYDNGANAQQRRRMNKIIADNPDIFPQVEISEFSPIDTDENWIAYFDQYAPRMGAPSSGGAMANFDNMIGEVDKRLAALDRAEEKYGKINDLEANVPKVQAGQKYQLRNDEVEEGSLSGVYDDTERAYVILTNSDRYYTDPAYGVMVNPIFKMDDKQKNTFISYMDAGMYDEGKAYLEEIKPYLNSQLTGDWQRITKYMADQDGLTGILTGAASVPMNAAAGVTGTYGTILSLFGAKDAQDPNSWYYFFNNMTNTIRSTQGKKLDDEIVEKMGEGWRGVGQFTYGLTMSIADNWLARQLGGQANGGVEAVSQGTVQLIMSSEAAAAKMVENLNRGLDPAQAALMAIGSGGIEALTEKVSLEALLNPSSRELLGDWKQQAMYLIKNNLAEGSEEFASDVLDMVMDKAFAVFYNNQTQIEEEAAAYVAKMKRENKGYTSADLARWEREGAAMAWQGFWEDAGLSALSGAASGGVSAFGRVVSTRANAALTGRNVRSGKEQSRQNMYGYRQGTEGENIRFLAKTGTMMDHDTNTYGLARDVLQKYYKGEKISNYELGKLAINYEAEAGEKIRSAAKDAIVTEIREQLVEEGQKKTPSAEDISKRFPYSTPAQAQQIAETIHKAVTQGIDGLNRQERQALMENDTAYHIYQGMVTPGTADISEGEKKIATAARMAGSIATATDRVNLAAVQSIAEGKGIQIQDTKVGKDRIGKARETIGTVKDTNPLIRDMGGIDAVKKSAGTVLAYTSGEKGNNEAKVGQIAGVKDGKVQVKFDDGSETTMDPAFVETMDGNTQGLLGFMKENKGAISDNMMNKALAALDSLGDKAAPNFANDVVRINLAAQRGAVMPSTSIDSKVAEELYNTARDEADAAEAGRVKNNFRAKPGKGTATWDGAKYGNAEFTEKTKGLEEETRQQIRSAAEIARIMGFNVNFIYDNSENGQQTNGSYDEETGTVTINVAAQRLQWDPETKSWAKNEDGTLKTKGGVNMLATIPHELTHWLQTNSENGYRQLQQFILKDLGKSGVDVDQLILDTIKNYNQFYKDNNMNRQATVEDALYEITANACEGLFTSEEFANRLKKADAGLYGKVKEYVRNLIGRLKAALLGADKSMHIEARNLQSIDEMARIWLGAYDEVIHNAVENGILTNNGKAIVTTQKRLSIQQRDNEYAQAVESQDKNEERQILDEAAREAGYTEKAYHGTDEFGFTEFNMDMGQGTIFVSYGKDVASTYARSDDAKVTPISQAVRFKDDVRTISQEELLDAARKYVKEARGEKIQEIDYNPDTGMYEAQLINNRGETISREYTDLDMRTLLRIATNKGKSNIYELYTRPGNQLVVDADGESWGHIEFNGETMDTREIAEWAKKNGYDSVRIDNVWDHGGHGSELAGYGSIGIFFNQDDVKSADLETYDDDGELIKPSERFSDSKDIRYSINEYYSEVVPRGRDYFENILTKHPDITITNIDNPKAINKKSNGDINIQDVLKTARGSQYTKSIKFGNATERYYTYVPDLKIDVELPGEGIRHGFGRGRNIQYKTENALIAQYAPEILQNAVEVNRGKSHPNESYYEHVLVGGIRIGTGNNARDYAVRIVIDNKINQQAELVKMEIIGTLHSIKEKKTTLSSLNGNNANRASVLPSYTVKLSDFFNDVKGDLNDTFAEKVYLNNGVNRKKTQFSSNLLYSVGSIHQTTDGTFETADGAAVAEELPGDVITAYSIRTVDQTVNEDLVRALVKKGFSEKKINKWIDDVFGVAKMIADDAQRLDFDPIGGTMLKNNQEYIKTLDSSTLCAKRLLYQGIFNQIQHMLPNTPLMPDDLIRLTNMMKERGMVTPCSICYVESRRRLLGKYASEWLKDYNGAYKPRIEEVTTTDGLQALRESDDPAKRQAAEDFDDAMNAKGSANPKVVQLRSEYRGEIKDMTDRQIRKVKEIGGLRVQSFSDFETVHLLDMMQAVMDMAAKDLTSQAYTKVPNFAWVFGDTGIKINLSLIGDGTGLDENGNLKFSSTEGMDINEAIKLRKAYSKNVGTILVGMNDEHIIAAMGDDRIDFIIPFHKSGWGKREMAMMIGMGTYKDFTRWQNEKLIEGRKANGKGYKTIPNKKSKISNLEPVGPNGYWNFSKDGTWNAEKYLKLCAKEKRMPKFANFLIDNGDGSFRLPTEAESAADKRAANIRNGYWKLLIDFKMYDNSGKGSPQTEVTPNFNMEAAYRVLNEYEGGADSLPTNDALAQAFVDEYKADHPGKKDFSILQNPDIDIDRWMLSVPESSLQTEAERELLRNYKGLNKQIEIDEDRIRNIRRQIRFLQEKKNKTKEENRRLDGLKIRRENAENTLKIHQKQMDAARAKEGFAEIMRQQQEKMSRFTSGRTQQEVITAIEDMEKAVKNLQGSIDRTAEELEGLTKNQRVAQIRAQVGSRTLEEATSRIRKIYNTTMEKKELGNRLAEIRMKLQAGMDVNADLEDLAGEVINHRRSSEKNSVLEAMRGMTIKLGEAALKEIYGTDSSLKEIRKDLAGSGIKVEVTKNGGALDTSWDELLAFAPELDHYNGIDTDNALNQPKAVAEYVRNAMENQRNAGRQEYEGQLGGVMVDLMDEIGKINMNLPADPKAREAIESLSRYVAEIAGKADMAEGRIREVQQQMNQLLAQGRKAASWNRSMKQDVEQTIDYFNMTAKLAVEQAKQTRQSEIIQQLKNEHVQKMLKVNDQWRQMIERDAEARNQAEQNAMERRKMTVVTTRLAKLLSSPTNTKNIPEVMNPLARRMVELIVSADLSEGGRKISNIQRKDLFELKRRLDAWNARDGVYDPNYIADENIRDLVNVDLDNIEDAIREWNGKYNGKNHLDTLQQMGQTLTKMQEAVSEIYGIIQAQREISVMDRKIAVADQAEKVKYQTLGRKAKERTGKIGRAMAGMHRAIISGNMTPEYFFRTLGNSGLNDLWNEYHRAENRNGLELAKAQAKIADIAEKHGYKEWDTEKRTEIQLEKGGKVNLTLGQMMSLWATWNREKTLGPEMSSHLENGGFYAEEQDLRKGISGKTTIEKKAHRVTQADMDRIGEILTSEQKDFVDDIVKFMSNDLSQLGNEASMIAYGIKMYKEKYYFPFQMWDGIKSRKSNDSGSAASRDRAFHPSFSKTRMHGANNALVIGDFMQTAADHAVGMINYATMGLANDTFQKVLNQTVNEGTNAEDMTKRNIRTVLEEAYGMEAMQYLRELQDQLNGGAVATRKSLGDRAISLFRKNAVAGSLSVAAQQPLSYLRAALMINPKYLRKGILTSEYWKGSYQELLEHSGVAVIKDMGRFDMGFGQSAREYLMPEGKEGGARKVWDAITDAATILPEKMDAWTWTRMWVAVKQEQKELHPDMDPKSDEFLDMCGTRFNDIMRRTQVYDSVLVKSSNMRSDNYWIKSLTSFMAEPTLTANVLADAVRQVKDGEKGAMGRLAGAGATFILSAILQSAVKGIMGAGRNPDDKKTFEENFLYRFWSSVLNEMNPASLIPGYGDMITLLKQGELSDDAMGAIGKIITAGKTGIDLLLGKTKKGTYRDIEDSLGQLAQLFTNLPAKNLMRDARAMYNFITQPYAERDTSWAVIKNQAAEQFMNADNLLGVANKWLTEAGIGGYGTKNADYYQRIYEAKKAGDTETAEELEEYLTNKGIKEKTIESGIKKLATAEENVEFMTEEGMDPNDVIMSQLKEGRITAEEARKQLKDANPDKDADSIWWKVDRAEYKKETGKDAGSGTYYRLWDAMDENKASDIGTAIDTMTKHGVKKESIKSQITKQYKAAYLDADSNGKRKIRDAIQKAYKKLGYTAADADKVINGWKK